MLKGMSQFVASPAHEALSADEFDERGRGYESSNLVDALPVYQHLARHDPSGRPLAAGDQPLLDKQSVDTDSLRHGSDYRRAQRWGPPRIQDFGLERAVCRLGGLASVGHAGDTLPIPAVRTF